MKKPVFTGAAVAIITPMHADGSVNYDELGRIIEDQIVNHTDAIVICGTTGESPALDHEEHTQCIRYTVQKVAGRVPVIAGTGSNDTRYAIQLSQQAQEDGADALLLVTPYYNKTSQAGLIAHYTAIANAVDLPCILYNVPSRTGCNLQPATILIHHLHERLIHHGGQYRLDMQAGRCRQGFLCGERFRRFRDFFHRQEFLRFVYIRGQFFLLLCGSGRFLRFVLRIRGFRFYGCFLSAFRVRRRRGFRCRLRVRRRPRRGGRFHRRAFRILRDAAVRFLLRFFRLLRIVRSRFSRCCQCRHGQHGEAQKDGKEETDHLLRHRFHAEIPFFL